MSNIYNPNIMDASIYNQMVNTTYANALPPILATEVWEEFEKRCANGMQYTTFPNTISEAEKAKLEAKGYIVTPNTVPSDDRYGQGALYIGFQVALNARAAEEAMQITPNDGGGSVTLIPKDITENGIYDPADDDADGYSSVNVEVSPTLENKNVTPTTSEQTITAGEDYDGLGTVTVEAVTSAIDANIIAGNIKKDVAILGVTGDYDPQPNLETLGVTPTTQPQSITPESPVDGYSSVSVSAVTSAIDPNIVAGNIKKDVEILGVTGSYEGSGGGYNATLESEGNEFTYSSAVLTSIRIPDGVDTIGYYACYQLTSLTDVIIPSGVTSIGERAFSECTSLTNLTISNGVELISDDTFAGCTSLTEVTIPSSVTLIGRGAFDGCTGLTEVTIPSSVTLIGAGAFSYCRSLTNLTISNGVETIGDSAFAGCENLTGVTIPSSVTSIGDSAFAGCENLTTITIHKAEGSITGAPWGAPNATVVWDG